MADLGRGRVLNKSRSSFVSSLGAFPGIDEGDMGKPIALDGGRDDDDRNNSVLLSSVSRAIMLLAKTKSENEIHI
jgi:hypothetical protein